jgi:peptidoglycan hydrolase-like protein with peptidoglycan-binding domain
MVLEGKLMSFIALLLAGQRGDASTSPGPPPPPPFPPAPPSPGVIPSEPTPGPATPPIAPAWPITPPSDLPPFPGPGWEYDEPVTGPVARRAFELITTLYGAGRGLGSSITEFVAGHWVTFHAERMANGKNGVAAWRVKQGRYPSPPKYGPPAPPAPSAAPSPPFIPVSPARPPPTPGGFSPAVVVVPTNPVAAAMSPADAQDALNKLGYGPLAVDGVIGPKTRAAIGAFQRANPPLVVDGIVGPMTKSVLLARLAALHGSPVTLAPQPARPGAVNTTRDVQAALNSLGYGPLVTDGIMGPKTGAATRMFQKARGLVVDGVPGPKTKAALTQALQQGAPA